MCATSLPPIHYISAFALATMYILYLLPFSQYFPMWNGQAFTSQSSPCFPFIYLFLFCYSSPLKIYSGLWSCPNVVVDLHAANRTHFKNKSKKCDIQYLWEEWFKHLERNSCLKPHVTQLVTRINSLHLLFSKTRVKKYPIELGSSLTLWKDIEGVA